MSVGYRSRSIFLSLHCLSCSGLDCTLNRRTIANTGIGLEPFDGHCVAAPVSSTEELTVAAPFPFQVAQMMLVVIAFEQQTVAIPSDSMGFLAVQSCLVNFTDHR